MSQKNYKLTFGKGNNGKVLGGKPKAQPGSGVEAVKPGTVPMKSAYHRETEAGTEKLRVEFRKNMNKMLGR